MFKMQCLNLVMAYKSASVAAFYVRVLITAIKESRFVGITTKPSARVCRPRYVIMQVDTRKRMILRNEI